MPGQRRVQKQAVDFFSLPLEEKNKVAKGPGKPTGYGFATLSDKKRWSEGFVFADDPSVDDFSRTLWSQGNNPDFALETQKASNCDSYREYDASVKALALKLMHVFLYLQSPDLPLMENCQEVVVRVCSESYSFLGFWARRPPCPEPEKTVRLTAHTDYNVLTVLHQGEIGGLQVEKDGQWIALRPREGAFAINVGDTLQALTNGKYKSVPHRAVVNRSDARISLNYFFVPTKSIPIYPYPELIQAHETGAPLYRPFTFEEFTSAKIVQPLSTLDQYQLSLR
ncbi:unnamed protein product [Sphagnum jensenii]|uniref:Fe2OG dioxygenase domain-containing protein n=1 Tax=Sphagnum jensenii TaxID=128206 RepID=A0ABP0VKI9_9BRYO